MIFLIILQLLTYDSLWPQEQAIGSFSNEKQAVCSHCGQTVYYVFGRGPYDKKSGYVDHKCTATPIPDISLYFLGAFFLTAILIIFIHKQFNPK